MKMRETAFFMFFCFGINNIHAFTKLEKPQTYRWNSIEIQDSMKENDIK